MKRVGRAMVTLSLVICLITAAMWVCSYWRADQVSRLEGEVDLIDNEPYVIGTMTFARSECGGVQVSRRDVMTAQAWPGFHFDRTHAMRYPNQHLYGWEGDYDRINFDRGGFTMQVTGHEWRVIVPHWFIAMLTAIAPMIACYRKWSRRRMPRGYEVITSGPLSPEGRGLG